MGKDKTPTSIKVVILQDIRQFVVPLTDRQNRRQEDGLVPAVFVAYFGNLAHPKSF